MCRTVCLLAVALLALPSPGSDSPKGYDGAAEADDIQGTWELIAIECNLETISHRECVATYRGGTHTVSYGHRDAIIWSYRLDTTHKPAHLDWVMPTGEFAGWTTECIYQIDGDMLRIAFNNGDDGKRPRGFDEAELFVTIYKRVK